ncbi:MAG: hypothetical protein ACJA0N_002169 [Pseudohongiellaceae bacterium]|jgi:hypothetical protein
MLRLFAYFSIIILAGCGTTAEITTAWVEPNLQKKELKGVLVIAVTDKQTARVNFEDAYTKALNKKGATAIASHTLVPGKATKEAVIAAAKKAGLDTLLVSHYVGRVEEPVYYQGTTYYGIVPAYGGGYHNQFDRYYGQVVKIGSSPDIWRTNNYVLLVSDLYETATEKPIWQAGSRSIDPDNRKELRNAFIDAFVDQMAEQGLLN